MDQIFYNLKNDKIYHHKYLNYFGIFHIFKQLYSYSV